MIPGQTAWIWGAFKTHVLLRLCQSYFVQQDLVKESPCFCSNAVVVNCM